MTLTKILTHLKTTIHNVITLFSTTLELLSEYLAANPQEAELVRKGCTAAALLLLAVIGVPPRWLAALPNLAAALTPEYVGSALTHLPALN